MALKRKRSSPGFSSPASDASITTTNSSSGSFLPFFYAQSKPVEPLYNKPTWSFPRYDDDEQQYKSTADMNSRTRKRHRDDRPEEEAVYSNTISRLFNAQRQHPHAEPTLSQDVPAARAEQPQRSTLHAFWRIPKPAPAPIADVPMAIDLPTASTAVEPGMRCEDCDDQLQSDNAMDLDDEYVAQETACMSCKRCVCDRCAVLGNARICLGCASGHER